MSLSSRLANNVLILPRSEPTLPNSSTTSTRAVEISTRPSRITMEVVKCDVIVLRKSKSSTTVVGFDDVSLRWWIS